MPDSKKRSSTPQKAAEALKTVNGGLGTPKAPPTRGEELTLYDIIQNLFLRVPAGDPPFNPREVFTVGFVCLVCGKKERGTLDEAGDRVKHHVLNRHKQGFRVAREVSYYSAQDEAKLRNPYRYVCVGCGSAHAKIHQVANHICDRGLKEHGSVTNRTGTTSGGAKERQGTRAGTSVYTGRRPSRRS